MTPGITDAAETAVLDPALACELADGSADGSADGTAVGTGEAVLDALGVAAGTGVGLGGAGLAGVRATLPPSSNAAATIPTTSPATIDRRPITAGAYQYKRLTAPLSDR